MKKFSWIFFFFLFSNLFAQIFEIKNIEEVEKYLQKDSLIIFDLDNTLIETSQELGGDQWFEARIKYFSQTMPSQEAFEKTYDEWYQLQSITKNCCVEKKTKAIFDKIVKNYQAFALTTRGYDTSHCVLRELKRLKLDFSNKGEEAYFLNKKLVLFKEGIIFANGLRKAEVFFQYFEKHKPHYKKIIFIDDKKSHLENFEKFCAKEKIDFVGLRYGFLDDKVKNLSTKLIEMPSIDLSSFIEKKQKEIEKLLK